MPFEWDAQKSKKNYEKHGIDFEDARHVFLGKIITFLDDRYDYNEERFITLGELKNRVVIIVHTQRGDITRIISMRKANEREKKIYYQRSQEIG